MFLVNNLLRIKFELFIATLKCTTEAGAKQNYSEKLELTLSPVFQLSFHEALFYLK